MTHPMLLAAAKSAALGTKPGGQRAARARPAPAGLRARAVLGVLLCGLSLCSTAMAKSAPPTCEALLFNSPVTSLRVYHPVAGEQITVEGFPSIWVRVLDLPRQERVGLHVTAVDAGGAALATARTEVTPEGGAASWRYRLRAPIATPVALQVEVTQGSATRAYREQVRLHRLSGRMTDFHGQPRAGYVMALGYEGLLARANAEGVYELWVPEAPLPALAVLDETWGKPTVETWVYDWYPRHDVTLDPRLGGIEVYELHAWRGASGLKADFVPMSVGLTNRLLSAVGREKLSDFFGVISDAKPYLNREGIAAELNGKPLEVRDLTARVDLLARPPDGAENSRPEYTLQLTDAPHDGAPGQTQVLRVTARRRHLEGRKVVEEQGEGYYLGLRSYWWATSARLP